MTNLMKNCWEIKQCGRENGGNKVRELGECVASIEGLGHSCWAIAGTLCGGVVQGSVAQKEGNCVACEVYKLYQRMFGTFAQEVPVRFPEEEHKYNTMLLGRMRKKS
jgi:hypothetical protein